MLDSYLKDLDKVYTEKIYPDLKKAEKIRKQILLNYTIIGTVLFSGMLVEAITWMSIAIVIIILFVLVYTRWYGIPVSKYERSYIHAITAKKNGIEHTYEYFNGIVIVADAKPEINGNLIICSGNELLKNYLPLIKDIKIDNSEQEDLTIFSDDDKAAKKYATPQLLNVLREYHLHTDNNVMFSVYETGFSLAILHDRRFTYLDPSVFSTAFNKKVVETYYRDLMFLIENFRELH